MTGGRSGSFLKARARTWFVEAEDDLGPIRSSSLVSVEDDSQGERLELSLRAEVDAQVVDPEDWSTLHETRSRDPNGWAPFSDPPSGGRPPRRTASCSRRRSAPASGSTPISSLPCAKALRLPRVNLLIADESGLGKTVEAGLIVREMLLRRRVDCDRRRRARLDDAAMAGRAGPKFGLAFSIVDREHLLETRRTRGFAANPWSIGRASSSRTAADRRDLRRRVARSCSASFRPRSLFILDEAHHAAPSSGRATPSTARSRAPCASLRGGSSTGCSSRPRRTTATPIASPRCWRSSIRSVSPAASSRGGGARAGHGPAPQGGPAPTRPDHSRSGSSNRSGSMDWRRMRPSCASPSCSTRTANRRPAERGRASCSPALQQRLFSSIAAFHRTLTTHRRTLSRRRATGPVAEGDAEAVARGRRPDRSGDRRGPRRARRSRRGHGPGGPDARDHPVGPGPAGRARSPGSSTGS